MTDSSTTPPMSDDEIAKRLAELEASIAAETPRQPSVAAAASKVLLGDEPDDGALDYLTALPAQQSASVAHEAEREEPTDAKASRSDTKAPKTERPQSPPPQPPRVIADPIPGGQSRAGGSGSAGSSGRSAADMAETLKTNEIVDRAIGVARFAPRYYDAIAADPKATAQAALVVTVVAVATGLGGLRHGLDGFIAGVIMALVHWGLMAAAANGILPRVAPNAPRQGGIAPFARTLGYAQGPRILAVAGVIPLIGWSLSVVGSIWVILTSIVAIRQTGKVGFGEATITAVAGWVLATIVSIIIALIFGLGVGAVL